MAMIEFPKYLSIQTTSMCNAACVFCPYQEIKNTYPSKVMDMALYKKIIEECKDYKNIERVVLYMNNEPLTDPYLIDRINYAKKKVPWASTHILTNGLSLTEENADKLIGSGLDWIGISFHGIRRETIEKAMGIPFEITLNRINSFIEKARSRKNIKEYIMVTFLRHKYLTIEEKNEAVDYWKNKGIERISYFDGPVSRAGNVKDLRNPPREEKITGCRSIWADEMIHIVEDGKVVLCCMDWKREVILGDLNFQSIYDLWNGKRNHVWESILGRDDMPDSFLCKRCEESIVDNKQNIEINKPDISLINLPPWGVNVPPLGTACLSSYLRSKGVKTEILDLNIELYNKLPEEHRFLWSMNYAHWWTDRAKFLQFDNSVKSILDSLIDKIAGSAAEIIGISSVTNSSNLVLEEIVKRIKSAHPSKKIILGGINITVKEQRISCLDRIKEYVDYCVVGEGEKALHNLLLYLLNNKDSGRVKLKGVLNRENFFEDSKLDFGFHPDELPYPTFEEFNLLDYKAPNCVLMEFSRGCVGNCPFCSIKGAFPFFKSKTADYIFNQIKFYKEKFGIEYVSTADAACNGDIRVIDKLCDLLIENDLSVNITGLAIPRKEMTEGLLKKMKKAGFFRLEYGVESGSDKILKAMRKIFNAQNSEKVIRDTYKAGIDTCIYLMVGYPGETEEDFDKTKGFLERNNGFISLIKSINPLYLITGSEIFNNMKKHGISFPGEHGEFNWSINAENNTVNVRKKRIRELKSLAAKLAIPYTEEAECIEFTNKGIDEDILLVMTPPWEAKKPPLGLAYLSSFLRSQNIKAKVIDLNTRLFNGCEDSKRYLWDISTINSLSAAELAQKIITEFRGELEDFITEVCESSAKIIGFSTTIASTGAAVYLAHQIKIKDPSKITIIGGPGCYWNTFIIDPERLVDIFVVGEGEMPLLEIVKRFKKQNSLSDLLGIKGTVLCIDKEYHSFLPPEPTDIKTIPFPDFSEFNPEDYNKGNNYKPLPILISRGCINNCSFCIDHKMNYPFRIRDPRAVVEEIKFHSEKGMRDFELNDLLCNGNLKHLEKICDLIIEEKLDIKWTSYAAIREGMTLELCKKMRRAGCRYICYGMESASDLVLKNMNKRYDSKTAEEVIRNTHNAGIETAINIIIGYPGESEEEFRKTCAFIKRNRDYIDQVTNASTCFLMLDTDLMNNLDKFGVYFKPVLENQTNSSCGETEQAPPNYREYYANPDNTPSARALWLRRFLKLLNKLRIPWVIVNYVCEHDRDMVNFIQRIGNSIQTLKCRDFRLDFSNKGQCKIYYNNTELTRDVGMNSSFFINDRWVDSASAEWRVKQNSMSLEIDMIWHELPITQKWIVSFGKKDKSIDWKLKIHFNDNAKIFQHKIGVMLSDKYNKYEVNGLILDFPDAHKEKWDDILFSELSNISFISDSVFPEIIVEPRFKKDMFLQLQNTPSNLFARMANFCLSSNNHPHPGVYKDRGYDFHKGDTLEGRIKVYLKP